MKLTTFVLCGVLVLGLAGAARGQTLDPRSLATALDAKPTGAEAEQLAARIRTWFGGTENLVKGPAPKIDDLTVAWAIEVPGLAANVVPRVVSDVVAFTRPMVKVGDTGLYAVRRDAVARLRDDVALRGAGPAARRRAARGLRNAPGQPRAAGRP